MAEQIEVMVNAAPVKVEKGTTVAVALALAGAACRWSVSGQPRGPLCGMGICYECRASVDGVSHRRTCQITCRPGMDIRTQ